MLTAREISLQMRILVGACLWVLASSPMVAEGPPRPRAEYSIPRTDSEITIDARLDESAWQKAARIDLQYETRPGENTPAPVETECLVTYDTSNVYVAFKAYDDDPKAIRAHIVDRDTAFNDDLSHNETTSWDAIWRSAGRITEEGYVVEMAIPFHQLRFPSGGEELTWGFDAIRFHPRSDRVRIASQPMDRGVSCYLCQISKVTGF